MLCKKLSGVFRSETALRWLQLVAGAAAIGLIFWRLQFSTGHRICCGDFDGYYHIHVEPHAWDGHSAAAISRPSSTWLPLTTLQSERFTSITTSSSTFSRFRSRGSATYASGQR